MMDKKMEAATSMTKASFWGRCKLSGSHQAQAVRSLTLQLGKAAPPDLPLNPKTTAPILLSNLLMS